MKYKKNGKVIAEMTTDKEGYEDEYLDMLNKLYDGGVTREAK
jgi:hypothetical protein